MAIELSRTHPWPGLATYEEDAQAYFFGREHETQALVRQIRMAPLTVLYGRSGLGKSSLLKAGVFPQLRAQCYLPVYLRLTYGANARIDPVDQIAERLAEEIAAAAGLDGPGRGPTETLWHWLHRKEFELWSADNRLWTPVLVFDQFEELFSRTGGDVRLISKVFDTLADLYEAISITQSVVFVNTRRKAEWLAEQMTAKKFTVSSLVGAAVQFVLQLLSIAPL